MNKSRIIRWAGNVARIGRRGMHTRIWRERQKEIVRYEDLDVDGDNIKLDLIKIRWGCMDWINQAQHKEQWEIL
jgi:hypothetical protein